MIERTHCYRSAKKCSVSKLKMIEFLTVCTLASALPFATSFRDTELRVTSDGPAVLDATINFKAVLINSDSYSGPFYFRWGNFFSTIITKDAQISVFNCMIHTTVGIRLTDVSSNRMAISSMVTEWSVN